MLQPIIIAKEHTTGKPIQGTCLIRTAKRGGALYVPGTLWYLPKDNTIYVKCKGEYFATTFMDEALSIIHTSVNGMTVIAWDDFIYHRTPMKKVIYGVDPNLPS